MSSLLVRRALIYIARRKPFFVAFLNIFCDIIRHRPYQPKRNIDIFYNDETNNNSLSRRLTSGHVNYKYQWRAIAPSKCMLFRLFDGYWPMLLYAARWCTPNCGPVINSHMIAVYYRISILYQGTAAKSINTFLDCLVDIFDTHSPYYNDCFEIRYALYWAISLVVFFRRIAYAMSAASSALRSFIWWYMARYSNGDTVTALKR